MAKCAPGKKKMAPPMNPKMMGKEMPMAPAKPPAKKKGK